MADSIAKRRRLDSGVHKPFVSPLKHRVSDSTATPPLKVSSNAGVFKKPALPSTPGSAASRRPSTGSTPTPLRASHTPTNKPVTNNTFTSTTDPSSVHSTIALQSQLTALRTSLDTLRQAQRLLSRTGGDSDLSSLRDKWQAATRLAVEELYTSAVERMNRLGGVSAWREGERQKKERMEEWRRDDERMEEERVLSEMDRELVGQIGGGGADSDEDDDKDGRKRARKSERRAEKAALQAAREEMVAARTEAREIARAEMVEDGYEAEQKREAEEMDRAKGLVGDDDDVSICKMDTTC